MLASLLIPLALTGLGWVGWKLLQSQMIICDGCGTRLMKNTSICPLCGSTATNQSSENQNGKSVPASSVTIDVEAEDLEKSD